MTPIHITALRHSAFYSPLLYTISSGLLQQEGLQPHYAPATPDTPVDRALLEGRAQVAQSAVAVSFAELRQGVRPTLRHFAQINERDGFFLAARGPMPGFRWADLEGREVLVDHFFQPLAMLRYACRQQGVDYNRIKVIDAGDVAAIDAAFRAGRGEFVHQQGPAPQQLERDGLARVVASVGEAVGPVAFSSLCAREDWLETDMARAFTRAYSQGRAAVASRPAAEVAEVVAAFLPQIQRPVLVDTIAAYQAMGTWQGGVAIPEAAYERLLEVFIASGEITERYAYAAAISPPPGV